MASMSPPLYPRLISTHVPHDPHSSWGKKVELGSILRNANDDEQAFQANRYTGVKKFLL